ncbi:MAG: homoserine dehydrogenase [Endomicrobiales bacterium]|nr:homoserine dehydrogenase [Endomicrobiales bacterium]
MKKAVNIGLVGCGNVGRGVINVLERNRRIIEQKIGAEIKIGGVCDVKNLSLKGYSYTRNYKELINNPGIDIIIELIGGYEPARTIILESLKAGKNVVTANKAVLAKYWDEIFSAARKYKKLVYFEASVAGAIPVIQALNEGLAANRIEKISGILNGTTNYVLSEMTRSGVSFNVALNLAKSAGFAEANPTYDIEGLDTAHKLAILSSLAWATCIRLKDISIAGIKGVSEEDVFFTKHEFGYVIKLIGSAQMIDNSLDLRVEPCLVRKDHTFASVEREYNAVLMRGDSSGDVILYGKGAGQFPAASAVVSDIIFLGMQVVNGTAGKDPFVVYDPDKKIKLLPKGKREASYYLRFTAADRPGVLSKVSGVLAKNKISIASVYQKEPLIGMRKGVPILMLIHRVQEGNLLKALKEIDRLGIIKEKSVKYRIED